MGKDREEEEEDDDDDDDDDDVQMELINEKWVGVWREKEDSTLRRKGSI